MELGHCHVMQDSIVTRCHKIRFGETRIALIHHSTIKALALEICPSDLYAVYHQWWTLVAGEWQNCTVVGACSSSSSSSSKSSSRFLRKNHRWRKQNRTNTTSWSVASPKANQASSSLQTFSDLQQIQSHLTTNQLSLQECSVVTCQLQWKTSMSIIHLDRSISTSHQSAYSQRLYKYCIFTIAGHITSPARLAPQGYDIDCFLFGLRLHLLDLSSQLILFSQWNTGCLKLVKFPIEKDLKKLRPCFLQLLLLIHLQSHSLIHHHRVLQRFWELLKRSTYGRHFQSCVFNNCWAQNWTQNHLITWFESEDLLVCSECQNCSGPLQYHVHIGGHVIGRTWI